MILQVPPARKVKKFALTAFSINKKTRLVQTAFFSLRPGFGPGLFGVLNYLEFTDLRRRNTVRVRSGMFRRIRCTGKS